MGNSNFSVSLTGLQNTSQAIDTVSNNIANANTVGYKAGEYVFSDQFLKAMNPVDSARTGMGVQSMGVRRPNVQGAIVNSENPLDFAISGKGMFRLVAPISSNVIDNDGTPTVDPAAVYYTRNGQFGLDRDGYIVNENGMYLTGYQPTADGTGITDTYIANNGLLKMPPANLSGRETTTSQVSAMLDSTGSAFTTTANVEFDPTQNTYNNKTTQTVFDYEGNRRTLELFYRRITDSKMEITYSQDPVTGLFALTYSPGPSSEPGIAGTTKIEINKMSVMRVDTAADYSNQADQAVVSSNSLVLSSDIPSAITLNNKRLYVNGVDTGAFVQSVATATKTITLNSAVSIPSGATVSFYPAYVTGGTATVAAGSISSFLDASVPNPAAVDLTGYRVFIGGVDTGANVASVSGTTVGLSRTITTQGLTGTVEYRPVLDMTLIPPDGTNITVEGTTNDLSIDPTASWKFLASVSNVEVYASIDGRFYDRDALSTSNRQAITQEVSPNTLGYKPVSFLSFIGGKNIDGLIKDPVSGNPLFRTTTTLSTKVTGIGTGVTDLVFDLDLTDTTLQPGAFQILSSVQNGEPLARLSNVTIDNAGRIVGVYGTGKQVFVGQLALADFTAFEELVPVGKNAFAPTAASGTESSVNGVVIGRAGTGQFGEIKSQALESSNVNLANELVRLMVMQRSYTANSQGLKAVDGTLRDMLDVMR